MKKSHYIIIITVFLVILFSTYYVNMKFGLNTSEATLIRCFERSAADTVSTEIYFWAKINNDKYNDIKQLKLMVSDFTQKLGVKGNNGSGESMVMNDLIKEVKFNGFFEDGRIINISAQINTNPGELPEKHLMVSVIEDLSFDKLKETKREVERLYQAYNIVPEVNICITGCYDGKLDEKKINNVCNVIIREAGAKKIEGISETNLFSVSAYSPVIKNYIMVNKSRINLNLALRYNSYEEKTYIWLATPIINSEY